MRIDPMGLESSSSNSLGLIIGVCQRSMGGALNLLFYSGGLSDCDVIVDRPSHCKPIGIPNPNIGTGTPPLPATPMQNSTHESEDDGSNSDSSIESDDNLSVSDRRSIRSNQKQIREHEEKLKKFLQDPDSYDNQGHLKNAGSNEERRQRIIEGRANHLRQEIRNFQNNIDKIRNKGNK